MTKLEMIKEMMEGTMYVYPQRVINKRMKASKEKIVEAYNQYLNSFKNINCKYYYLDLILK